MRKRWLQSVFTCLVAVVILGANDPDARFDRVGHRLMCACSCGQILLECNHVSCPDSPHMITELRQQVAASPDDTPIYNWFVNKYGAVILAAPIRGGFDTVAWIAPIAVFLFGTVGTALLVRNWTRRHHTSLATASAAHPPTAEHAALRDRIRREVDL